MFSEKPTYSEEECIKLFEQFFKDAEGLLSEFAPNGWSNSPLYYIFHPTPQQRYEEALRFHRNINSLLRKRDRQSESEEPKFSDFLNEAHDEKIEPHEELVRMIGFCLWDIFSDNHEVISKDGKVYDTGSFRGSGGFIADYINSQFVHISSSYDYMDFYMGSIFVNERADLTPIYLWIFRNLKRLHCDWIYSFPRMHLISFDKSGDEEKYTGPLEYDPNKALQEELEKKEKEESVNRLQEELDEAYHKDVEDAKDKPLPKTVLAYKTIYGRLPKGWPHQ